LRLSGALRAEGAAGDLKFARAAVDLTMTRNLPWRLAGALTVSGGTSTGEVPSQRLWYLGGTHTVRGHPIGTNAGDAYWLGRGELSTDRTGFRPVVFFDAGWAGSRADWSHPGKPMLGAGLGWSIFEGLVRFDLAKGIRPNRGVRASLYLDANF
jgi:hemolysin activation/secretion protein